MQKELKSLKLEAPEVHQGHQAVQSREKPVSMICLNLSTCTNHFQVHLGFRKMIGLLFLNSDLVFSCGPDFFWKRTTPAQPVVLKELRYFVVLTV